MKDAPFLQNEISIMHAYDEKIRHISAVACTECQDIAALIDAVLVDRQEFVYLVNDMLCKAGYSFRAVDAYGINAVRYEVMKPDGTTEFVWSPVWGTHYEPERSILAMLAVALGVVSNG